MANGRSSPNTKLPDDLVRTLGPPALPKRQSDPPISVLGPDISISGQNLVVKTTGTLLIAGQVHGAIHAESVTVSEGGSVTGMITANVINIQGEAHGALIGTQVILQATARFEGEIINQTLLIAEGAYFDGSVRRARDVSEITPDL